MQPCVVHAILESQILNFILLFLALCCCFAGFVIWKIRSRDTISNSGINIDSRPKLKSDIASVATPGQSDFSQRLVIGERPDHPVITIEHCTSLQVYEEAKLLPDASTTISRLGVFVQAVPAVLTAVQMNGKQIMEVTINGSLTRAADGVGFRAFTTGPRGITEHAKLFDVQNLQTMVNAAAIWQVASVLVAQKHLADISRKLDEIKDTVQNISQFLDNQRKARIHSTFSYLSQAYTAISGGELSHSVRAQLESCERDLLEIQAHLEREYRQVADKPVLDDDTFGTESLTNNLLTKTHHLNSLASDMALCLKTRITAWHVLALYPGEPQLKLARQQAIQASLDGLPDLVPYVEESIEREIAKIKSMWNTQETLDIRKNSVRRKVQESCEILLDHVETSHARLKTTGNLLLEHDRPMRLLFEFENGVVLGVRELT